MGGVSVSQQEIRETNQRRNAEREKEIRDQVEREMRKQIRFTNLIAVLSLVMSAIAAVASVLMLWIALMR